MSELVSVKNIFWRPADHGGREILKNISFTLGKNDITILRGKAGSGKTSLLRILAGKAVVSSGTLCYNGKSEDDITPPQMRDIRNNIGYISENPFFIYSKNLYQNIEYVLRLHRVPKEIIFDRIMHILKLTELISKRDLKPSDISRTEKKYFALALALSREVAMLLCDLNMTGSPEEEDVLRLLINAANKGIGVVVTASKSADFNSAKIVYADMLNGELR